jgi:hypothetical protein
MALCWNRWQTMKLISSYKDLILILGIVVAIIVSITTWMNTKSSVTSLSYPVHAPNLSPKSVSKIGQTVINLTQPLRRGH